MKLSIVSTLYKSAPYIDEFVQRSLAAAEMLTDDVEVILVDDGSPDDSLAMAKRLAEQDSRVVVVELSRNFGHHKAILAGLRSATGDRVFYVDSDLEERPELLLEFAKVMDDGSFDVVFGVNGSARRRGSSTFFWRFFNWASDTDVPLDMCHVRLMTRAYAESLSSLSEVNVFIGGLYHWVGYRQVGVPIDRQPRRDTTYSFASRAALAVRSVVSFSTVPLKAIFWCGCLLATVSALMAAYFAIARLLTPDMPMGYTSILVSLWFLGGAILAAVGLIGIYVAYAYAEIKGRPQSIIRQIHRRED